MAQPKEALPTQQFVEIKEVRDGVLILKNGALRQILMVSGINFDLKSEEEQGLITFAYQNFLNSLDFSLQTFIHSRKLNIEDYLVRIKQAEAEEPNELLKNQIAEYHEFVKNLVGQNPIMAKSFFVVVPFDPIVIPGGAKGGPLEAITGIFGKKKEPKLEEAIMRAELEKKLGQYLQQLQQRIDQVISGLNSIGLRAVPLSTEEVIELFYNLYNPEAVEKKKLAIAEEQP